MRATLLILGLTLALGSAAPGQTNSPSLEHFEKKVRPILVEHCVRCHGPEKQKGGLRLDNAAAFAKGGETGPTTIAGKPDASLLLEAVRYAGDLKMPPKGKLAEADINALLEWVRAGSPWTLDEVATPTPVINNRPLFSDDQKAFWAFQPVRDPALPVVQDAAWPTSPIDRFILAGLEANKLHPSPRVDRRTLIRRATFDLIGLPPTPEEVSAFLSDDTPEAFARLIDRLLASPRYGERWGRFWLDLARYADSNGMDENVAYAAAWHYRDYVIAAFNKDKPYDQFLKEQIAGDLLPASSEAVAHEQIKGTGFLVLGPKMLAEDDPMKMEMDIIDEQVDTVSKVFLGMTLGCARCHDHKFDPLPTADYYAMAGIFKSTKTMQNHGVVAMWNERPLTTPAGKSELETIEKAVVARKAELQKLTREARDQLKRDARNHVADYLILARKVEHEGSSGNDPIAEGVRPPGTLIREAESFDRGNVGIDHGGYGLGIGVIHNVGPSPNFAEYDVEIGHEPAFQLHLRYAAAESRPVRIKLDGVALVEDVAGKATGSWNPDTQRWTLVAWTTIKPGKHILRIERDAGPIPHFDKLALVPQPLPGGVKLSDLKSAEEQVKERSLNLKLLDRWIATLAKAKTDSSSVYHPWVVADSTSPARTRLDHEPRPSNDQELATRYQQVFDEALKADSRDLEANPALASFRKAADDPDGPISPAGKPMEGWFPAETTQKLNGLRQDLKALQGRTTTVTKVMGVEDRAATNLKVHIRGSHLTLGEEAPRRFLRVVAGENQPTIGADRSGRVELADWMTRPDHPLTARVMVNRLWLWHFGQGIVRTPDNFGKLGERPSHPELLDWLARRFVESGWSLKSMHKMIMLSSTYQMTTKHDEAALLVDPDNRLLWRFDRRRLEAEAIRDSLLAISGELSTEMGGTRLKTNSHDYVNTTGSAQASALYEVNLRSVYLPVIRSGVYSVFQAFDFADPSTSNGLRVATTVAPQALFMMNDTLALRTSAAWAKRLLARTDLDDPARVKLAYETAYARPPRPEEVDRALDYLNRFDALLASKGVKDADRPLQSWQALTQAILAASELITVE